MVQKAIEWWTWWHQGFFLDLSQELCEAIRVRVRYDTKDENGKTRRERNEDFDQDNLTPEINIPEHGEYLIEWYFELSNKLLRVSDGVCLPIPPSEFLAWVTLTGNVVRPSEYDILSEMDQAFCAEMNSELKDFQDRQKDKANKK